MVGLGTIPHLLLPLKTPLPPPPSQEPKKWWFDLLWSSWKQTCLMWDPLEQLDQLPCQLLLLNWWSKHQSPDWCSLFLTDILNLCGIPEEQCTSQYNHLGSSPFLLDFMLKMYPKYGEPVHLQQAGSFKSHFWLSLLQLLCILTVLPVLPHGQGSPGWDYVPGSHRGNHGSHYVSERDQKGAGLIYSLAGKVWQSMIFMQSS